MGESKTSLSWRNLPASVTWCRVCWPSSLDGPREGIAPTRRRNVVCQWSIEWRCQPETSYHYGGCGASAPTSSGRDGQIQARGGRMTNNWAKRGAAHGGPLHSCLVAPQPSRFLGSPASSDLRRGPPGNIVATATCRDIAQLLMIMARIGSNVFTPEGMNMVANIPSPGTR